MKYISTLFFILCAFVIKSQSISGVINSYAAVTSISGSTIAVGSTVGFTVGDQILVIQMQGASVVTLNNATFGNITSMGGAGNYEFKDITAITGSTITVNSALTNTYDAVNGSTQIVKVPSYCTADVTSNLTCLAWNGSTGGVLALQAGTLTLNANVTVDALGFRGGNFATSSFCCSIGNYGGVFNINGGKKGESISKYVVGQDGMKGKQANGGGAANCGNSGGGGGGNAGLGGIGGNQYNGCGGFDERGLGGLNLTPSFSSLFMGGAGGGGFRDNGQVATAGGNGGGIIFIKANQIICNNRIVSANGGSVTIIANDEGAGGGGAGGTIFIACNNYVGNLFVNTNGGIGGSNFNTLFSSNCHGPGGGGGGGIYAFTPPVLPGTIIYNTLGAAAGRVNNPASFCFNTTFGAAPGNNGSNLPNLPTTTLLYPTDSPTITGVTSICAGGSTTLTATGLPSYSWSPAGTLSSSTASVVVASPTTTTTYTIGGGPGACATPTVVTINMLPTPTLVLVASSNSLCVGQTSTLTVTGATSYTWNSASATLSTLSGSVSVASPSTTTTYSVIGMGALCTSSAVITITVIPTPTVSVNSVSICVGQTASLTATGATGYLWSTGATTNSITVNPTVTTNYTVAGSNGGVCSSSKTVSVFVYNYPSVIGSLTTDVKCFGDATGSISINAIDVDSYLWVPSGVTTSSIGGLTAGAYTCVLNAGPSCTTVSTFTITQPTLLIGVITATNTTCGLCNGIAEINGSGGTSPYTYNWLPSAGTQSVETSLCSGTNTAITTDANNCTSITTINILPSVPFITSVTASSTQIYQGEIVSLNGFGGVTYTWTPNYFLTCVNCNATIATPEDDIVYCVEVTDSNGCIDSACVEIFIKCGDVFLPNAFSPNNDGHNDELQIYGNCIKTLTFRIFDRWGEMVFESFDPKKKWDGKYKGYEVNAGVFVYQFSAKLKSGEFINKSGNITVVK